MNAGLTVNYQDHNNYPFCKIEITPFDPGDHSNHPNGYLAIADFQGTMQVIYTLRAHYKFLGGTNDKLTIGTTYHLAFWRTTGGIAGTYHCKVTGRNINPQEITWAPASVPSYDAATYGGLRIKVGEDSYEQEDSGATRFDNFVYELGPTS